MSRGKKRRGMGSGECGVFAFKNKRKSKKIENTFFKPNFQAEKWRLNFTCADAIDNKNL